MKDLNFMILPPGAEILKNQVAGHFHGISKRKLGLLETDKCILKPVEATPIGERELEFYLQLKKENDFLPVIRFLPRFYGIFQYNGIRYLQLENLCTPFGKHPFVLDLKIGRRTWDPLASPEKVARQKLKYPPAEQTGFQIMGMQFVKENQIIKHYKICGRKIKPEDLIHAFALFFGWTTCPRRDVIRCLIEKLEDLEVTFMGQHSYLFFAASLLTLYGHNNVTQTGNESNCQLPLADVRLIDFVHVFPNTDPSKPDENFLYGLHSYIQHLKRLLSPDYEFKDLPQLQQCLESQEMSCCHMDITDNCY